MRDKLSIVTLTFVLFGLLLSCNKEMRSMVKKSKSRSIADIDTAAVWFYHHKKYDRAIPLFEQLVPATAGTDRQPELYYYYGWSRYMIGELVSSAFYFEDFAQKFPGNEHREECEFMVVKCYYRLSDPFYLDQTYTDKAIAQSQLFLSRNPSSEYEDECMEFLTDLRERKAKKSIEQASLYFDRGFYKAAVTAYQTMIDEFPDSKFREEAQFMLFKSAHELAGVSTDRKKEERYEESISLYQKFSMKFPESDYGKEAENLHLSGQSSLEKLREEALEKEQANLFDAFEENMQLALRTTDDQEREEAVTKALKHYNKLKDDYPNSEYMSKAELLYDKMDRELAGDQ